MDIGNSSLSSGVKIKSIALVVAKKNAHKVQDYPNILVYFYEQTSLMVSAMFPFGQELTICLPKKTQ